MEDREQLELFSQTKGNVQPKARQSGAFRIRITGHEKKILLAIAFAVTGIASFSLGVEKGKRVVAVSPVSPRPEVALKPESRPVAAPVAAPVEVEEAVDSYTIQVASFLNKTNAEKEASTLKRKGMTALVLSKGKFSIVCVGNFSKREEAESFLPKMKKQYQDCRIRRL